MRLTSAEQFAKSKRARASAKCRDAAGRALAGADQEPAWPSSRPRPSTASARSPCHRMPSRCCATIAGKQLELRLQPGLGKPDPDAQVFGNEDGTPMLPNNMTRRWQDVCISRGLPQVMFHALRHTHASALIAAGIDVVKISRRLGHADPTVTLRTYAHLFDKVDTAAAGAIELALTQNAGATRDRRVPVPIRCQFLVLF